MTMVAINQETQKSSIGHGDGGLVEMKQPLQSWDLELSIPGTKYLIEKKTSKFHRFVWSIVLLAAFIGMLVVVGNRIHRLIQNPKSVNVKVDYNSSIMFPTVTICNKHMFTASSLYTYGKKELDREKYGSNPFASDQQVLIFQFVTDYFYYFYRAHADDVQGNTEAFARTYRDIIDGGPKDFVDFYNSSAQDIKNMILQCSWKGQPCGPQNFTKVMTDHGFCYVFNGNASHPFTTEAAGPRGGLRLVLNAETYNSLASWDMSAGFLVGITHPNETRQAIKDIGLQVSTGMQTYVGVRVSEFQEMHEKGNQSTCSKEETLLTCTQKCISAYVIEKCGCKEVVFDGDDVQVCSPYEMINCSSGALNKLVQLQNYSSYCNCLPACHRVFYDVTVTQSTFSEFGTTIYALKNGDIDEQLRSLFKIQDLSYLNAMSPKTVLQLCTGVNSQAEALTNDIDAEYSQCLTELNNTIVEMAIGGVSPNVSTCITEHINSAYKVILTDFKIWFNENYFTSHVLDKGYLDDFLVLVSHDILRKEYKFLQWLDEVMVFVSQANTSINTVSACFSGNTSQEVAFAVSDCIQNSMVISNTVDKIRKNYLDINDTISNHESFSNLPRRPSKKDKGWYKENYAFLDIFLEQLTVMKVVQNSDDNFNSLICDIGGSIGLYLGGSLLTLMELLDLLIWVCSRKKIKTHVIKVAEKPKQ